ncbi:MAG: TraR/DksA family transcriptional regulator [Bacteroidetes bacterium]|nr:MAG: TraR/DksA family transcriptional regulator [Bacteroidota bacterium]
MDTNNEETTAPESVATPESFETPENVVTPESVETAENAAIPESAVAPENAVTPETVAATEAVKTAPKKATRVRPSASKSAPVAKPEPVPTAVADNTPIPGLVPYLPDFTHSVLDAKPVEPEQKGPTMRYSDKELGEFKELIQRKLESAKKELSYLQGVITRKDSQGGDGEDGRYMTMEDGSLSMEREQLSQMASRQITFIDHLEKALMRIENKTYGVCRVTGKLIDKARLRAVPHATLSMDAKMGKVRMG